MNLQIAGVLAAILLISGVTLDRCAPVIGAHAQVQRVAKDRDSWKQASGEWKRAAGGWEASFRAAEQLRSTENTRARAAVADVSATCEIRVAKARQSAASIAALVTKEPKRDPQGCPIRSLVDAGQLRDALAPSAGR